MNHSELRYTSPENKLQTEMTHNTKKMVPTHVIHLNKKTTQHLGVHLGTRTITGLNKSTYTTQYHI